MSEDWRGDPPYFRIAVFPLILFAIVQGVGWLLRHYGWTGPQ